MAWTTKKEFNFRNTLAYVTDGANAIFVNDAFGAYPQTKTIGGESVDCGWEIALFSGNSRDRSTTPDVRIAGLVFSPSGIGNNPTFRVDLPSAGNFIIDLAAGDPVNSNVTKIEIRDTSTVLISIPETSTAAELIDATGVKRTSPSDWVANHVTSQQNFATTIFRIAMMEPSASNTCLSHFSIEQAPGGIGPMFMGV